MKIFDDQTLDDSTNAEVDSTQITLRHKTRVAIHLEWTGTAVSTFSLWTSAKPDPDPSDDDDWVEDDTLSFPSEPDGSAGKTVLPLSDASVTHVRVKVETSDGSGTLNGWAEVSP